MGGVINLVGMIFLICKYIYDNHQYISIRHLLLIPILISLLVEHPFINNKYVGIVHVIFMSLRK